jgi:hypothetical protein
MRDFPVRADRLSFTTPLARQPDCKQALIHALRLDETILSGRQNSTQRALGVFK